ncbi:MAG: AMMECR1 domain-containing protein [Desulfobacterales bacterium RIFOXYA12_FULL_46_15]|nr:MAG: AMMECR1 domain-containing protein [Desulfobacterales bacterium RIFOXYA12_FULL_46_15]
MKKDISEDDGSLLLKLARKSILQEFNKKKDKLISIIPDASMKIIGEHRGVFVSLHKKGNLKGCIGIIEPVKPLFEGVIENAKHAAFHDTRFAPLSFEEFEDTKVEISVLTIPERIEYKDDRGLISKIRPGIDGVIIKKKSHSATFLPQVWKQLKEPENFLTQLCMKAGLPYSEWKTGSLIVSTYQVQVFEEKN